MEDVWEGERGNSRESGNKRGKRALNERTPFLNGRGRYRVGRHDRTGPVAAHVASVSPYKLKQLSSKEGWFGKYVETFGLFLLI